MIKTFLTSSINAADRVLGLRALMREHADAPPHPLSGDRAIEWSWVVAHLPPRPSKVLDLGCVGSALAGIASRLGHCVTAVDLREIEYEMPGVRFLRQDVLALNGATDRFDLIMNCSFIEHVGLPDRYGSTEFPEGDLVAMQQLGGLLSAAGRMILTIPVGCDAQFASFHRVYGRQRLERLLENYRVLEQEYWHKDAQGKWRRCAGQTALETQGSHEYYALGLFVLEIDAKPAQNHHRHA